MRGRNCTATTRTVHVSASRVFVFTPPSASVPATRPAGTCHAPCTPASHSNLAIHRYSMRSPGSSSCSSLVVRLTAASSPPTSVVIDCLTNIAADFGCNGFDTNIIVLDERCGYTSQTTFPLLTMHQCTA